MYKIGTLKNHKTPCFKVFGECLGLFCLILVIPSTGRPVYFLFFRYCVVLKNKAMACGHDFINLC